MTDTKPERSGAEEQLKRLWDAHHEYGFLMPERKQAVEKIIYEAEAVARREALEEACKAQCKWCRGEDIEVNAEAHKIERQYVPNCGVMEGFVHYPSWGGSYECDADGIQRLMGGDT